MYSSSAQYRIVLAVALAVGCLGAGSALAQQTLNLYGPMGLSPAIEDAAIAFSSQSDVTVNVVAGTPDEWQTAAAANGDFIYSTGEFIMTDFVRSGVVPVDRTSLTKLYLRPSAILVRPGNPKDIRDFPDLLRPGMKVMMVNGSGQTGLWENLTGKLQSLQNLVALQKNVVLCEKTTAAAMKKWETQPEIDAWLTWNVWHMPRRDSAQIVTISKDYRIYRECSISLTERGKSNPSAVQFMEFLASAEGADIYDSWGWAKPPTDVNPAVAERGVCVAARIKDDQWTNSIGRGLDRVKRLVDEYRSLGIPAEDIHVCAVFDGDAGYWMLKDDPYRKHTSKVAENPNHDVVEDLVAAGVSIEISAETMRDYGWTAEDLLPGVKVVPGAGSRIATLGEQGYDFLPF